MAVIAELFGCVPSLERVLEDWTHRWCRFTNRPCDVTANRGDRAFLDLEHRSLRDDERRELLARYGPDPLPLGICSVSTQRRFESESKPWIICPKRMLDLRSDPPVLPPEVRAQIPIAPGTRVRCWWEFKFASNENAIDSSGVSRFFEYTFDYILLPVQQDADGRVTLLGPPYIIEVMTSSTRGGGLTEHMIDVLSTRPQRSLRGHVDSPYTPNYRQVFGRMASQLYAKSEVAEAWGGRTIWVLQDVLLDYIEQTTAFRARPFEDGDDGSVFMLVYGLERTGDEWLLRHQKTLRGPSRLPVREGGDFTSMLGVGYIPPLESLLDTLSRSQGRTRASGQPVNWMDLTW